MRKNLTNLSLLNKKISDSGLKKQKIAEALNVSGGYLAQKLSKPLDNVEIQALCDLLNISKKERDAIFFGLFVDKISTKKRKAGKQLCQKIKR